VGPSGVLARSWLRRNAVSTIALVLLVALATGAVAASLAGARRTSSALDRFLDHNAPPDLQVYGESIDIESVRALPEVAGSSVGAYGILTVEGPEAGPFPPGVINPFIEIESRGARQFRPYVIEGRDPAGAAAHLVALDEDAAERLGAGVGDELRLGFFLPEQVEELYEGGGEFPEPRGSGATVEVAAIVRHPFDLNPIKPADLDAVMLASGELYLNRAFWAAHEGVVSAFGGDGAGVELLLRDDADVDEVEAAIRAMPGGDEVSVEQRSDATDAVDDARQTVRFETVALLIFAALAALAGAVVVAQGIARQVRTELGQRDVLTGVGLTNRELAVAQASRMAPVAHGGAGLGIVVAWLASGLTPIGIGRRAEIDPGRQFDGVVFAGAAVVVLVAVLAWTVLVTTRSRRRPPDHAASGLPRRTAGTAARLGAPVWMVTGLAQLSGGGGRAARTPLRSSLGAVVFGLAAVVGVAVFAQTMDHFVDRPSEHGWTWDLVAGDADDARLPTEGPGWLDDEPAVAGYAAVWTGFEDFVKTDGVRGDLPIAGVDSLAGDTGVQVVEGAPPDDVGQVVLGRADMDAAGVGIGDEIVLDGPRGSAAYRVVGRAVFHELISGGFELDHGAVVTPGGLAPLFSGGDVRVDDSDYGDGVLLRHFLIDLEDGASVREVGNSLREHFGPTIISHVPPLDVASLDSVRSLPITFAGLVSVLGAASLVHLLLVTVRRRRSDFAVLATLGARPRQLAAVLACMATAIGVVAALVGLPVGVIAGRQAWLAVARGLGAPTGPQVSVLQLLVVVVVLVALVNLTAALPGRLATRVRPADALRVE
jgi:hypothetical protein